MKTNRCCILFIIIIGSIFLIPIKEDTDMKASKWKDLNTTSTKKPFNAHLIWDTVNGIYMVDSTNQNVLLFSTKARLVVDGSDWDTIATRAQKIQSGWHDRVAGRIYFVCCDNDGVTTDFTTWYLLLSDDSENAQDNYDNGVDQYAYDIIYSTTDTAYYVLGAEDVGGTVEFAMYKLIAGVWTLRASEVGFDSVSFMIPEVDYSPGVYPTVYVKLTGGNTWIVAWVDATPGWLGIIDLGANIDLPTSLDLRGISYDNSNFLNFIIKDTGDANKNKLMIYDITLQVKTKKDVLNISLMLDRNNAGTVPSELEKAFGLTDEITYELKPNRGGIIVLQDLSAQLSGNIVAITDTILFADDGGGTWDVYEYQDVSEQMFQLSYTGGCFPLIKKGTFLTVRYYEANWNEKDSIKVYDDNDVLEIWAKITKKYVDSLGQYHLDFDFYSNELARTTYEKTYSNDKTSEKLIDIIDNKMNFLYQSSSIVATAIQYDYVLKREAMYMFSTARWLENEILYAEPDCKTWSRAAGSLTATGKSWTLYDGNQDVRLVDIPRMAQDVGGYFKGSLGITRATTRYQNNATSIKPIAATRDPIELLSGIIEATEYRDAKLEAATEADQLTTNRYNIGSASIEFIGLRVEGEGFLQEGQTIQLQGTQSIIIPQDNFVILRYTRFPKQDITFMILSDNIIFPSEFTSFLDTTRQQIHAANLQSFENQERVNNIYGGIEVGMYWATENFRDEVDGTSEANIRFIDSTNHDDSNVLASIIALEDGHKKVIKFVCDGDNGKFAAWVFTSWASQTAGTIEFWWKYIDNGVGRHRFVLRDEGDEEVIRVDIAADVPTFQVYHAGTSTTRFFASDKWNHIKITFDCATDTFSLWLNNASVVAGVAFYLSRTATTIDSGFFLMFQFAGANAGEMYMDAWGQSWDPNYTIGDNLSLIIDSSTITIPWGKTLLIPGFEAGEDLEIYDAGSTTGHKTIRQLVDGSFFIRGYHSLLLGTIEGGAVTNMTLTPTGLTMGVPIAMGTNKVTGVGDPTNAQDAVTKAHLETHVTPEGGKGYRLTNKTGAASVKGTLIKLDPTNDNSFILTAADDVECMGVVYDNGVADGSECFIVTEGRCQMLLKDATASTRGNWIKTADVAGRADMTSASPAAAPTHFEEVGHCMESKGADTDVLAFANAHFN